LFQAYALGVGYDVMNGAIFSTLAVIFLFQSYLGKFSLAFSVLDYLLSCSQITITF